VIQGEARRRTILDGDGHYIEPPSLWSEYLAPGCRDRLRVVQEATQESVRVVLGDWDVYGMSPGRNTAAIFAQGVAAEGDRLTVQWGLGDVLRPGGMKAGRPANRPLAQAEPAGWSARRRLQVHDDNGIDAGVLFPTVGMAQGLNPDADLADAACTAINRWAADYASEAPDELYCVAALPWQDPPRAARELRRCVEQYGFVAGAIIPVPATDGTRLSDSSRDVLWQAAVELDVPICIHAASRADEMLGERRLSTFVMKQAVGHPLENMIAFATLYEGRVFERFPSLRIGFMECSCGWVPFWVERMTDQVEMLGWTLQPPFSRMPDEAFRMQCIVGCEGDERMVPYVQDLFGNDRVQWASDFPHMDTDYPLADDMLRRTDLTPEQLDGAMCLTAQRFYRIDLDAVRRSHERREAAVR
jgi:predicted TIM-barrel fold metal-dependent hydrolase